MATRINYKEVEVVTQCPVCYQMNKVQVNELDYLDWRDGALAQDAFPYLSKQERETLISSLCPNCWEKVFGDL